MTPDQRKVASAFLQITMELLSDPAEREAFERWLEAREPERKGA